MKYRITTLVNNYANGYDKFSYQNLKTVIILIIFVLNVCLRTGTNIIYSFLRVFIYDVLSE